MRFLLVFLCACRVSWSAHMGAPPRSTNDIKLALHAADETALTMARSALGRDPHVTLVDFDATVIEKARSTCGTPSCQDAVDAACSWAALQGAEYYAIATVATHYSASYECTRYDSSIFDKHDNCVEGHETNQNTAASYALDVYDVKTKQRVAALSQRLDARAWGPEDQSKPEALAALAAKVPAKSDTLPEQSAIGADGRVTGDARDGYYAVYQDGAYSGYVRVTGAGTPRERIRPLYCCIEPGAGDALVARGRRKFVELGVDGVAGYLSSVGTISAGSSAGLGAHLHHYALDGGLQLGLRADALVTATGPVSLALVTGEIGWGLPLAPGFVVSANLGVGRASLRVGQIGENGTDVTDATVHVMPSVRVQTFLATWWYVALDVGGLVTGDFDIVSVGSVSQRAAIAHLSAGFDL